MKIVPFLQRLFFGCTSADLSAVERPRPEPALTTPNIPATPRADSDTLDSTKDAAMLPKSKRRIDEIIIHCSATMPHQNFRAADIDRWHRERGWKNGNGYHGVVCRDGDFEKGRHVDIAGAHARGHNSRSIGIVMIGGLGRDNRPAPDFTRAQWRTLRRVVKSLQRQYPNAKVLGHRDTGANKACPSFDVTTWLDGGEVMA